MRAVSDDLRNLAEAHGVATWYRAAGRQRADVDPAVVRAVLAQLEVDTSSTTAVRQELRKSAEAARALPETVVLRTGQVRVLPGAGVVHREDGTSIAVSGRLRADCLPLGRHALEVGRQRVSLLVVPARLPDPPATWGWTVQLYGLRSEKSWGIGDFGDLRTLVRWAAGDLGAGLVLLNPLHAITPTLPVERSPHLPSSRQFLNPLYLRAEDTAAYRDATEEVRETVRGLRPPTEELIDYDAVWQAKFSALEALFAQVQPSSSHADPALTRFAVFCALAEQHGPDWRRWPAGLRHPANPQVARAERELAPRVEFHAWLQRQCADQLAAARTEATMSIGLVGDLAAGVLPSGADAWAMQDELASGTTIGTPPDAVHRRGQSWGLTPWRPDRLAATGYRPCREVVRSVLRHVNGIRVGHVAGLWRQWWIPPGESPDRGTYVRYDADAMLGVLALEAHRASAMVVGEDLGTVEPEVPRALHERGMLSSAVLLLQRHTGEWPAQAMASVSAHDLPTATGFLRAEHVRARDEEGTRTPPVEQERARARMERDQLVELLTARGVLAEGAGEQEIVLAMHDLLTRTPCRLLLAAPQDLLCETRQPVLPGATAYPNWRIPLPVSLEDLRDDPLVHVAVQPLREARPAPRAPLP